MPKQIWVRPEKVYTLKIELDESAPPIWRRVQVTDLMTLGALHAIIQVAMGWEDCHMHEFQFKDQRYSAKSPYGDAHGDADELDEDEALLGDVIRRKGQRFAYWYDFGDDWMHTIRVEAIEAFAPGGTYPICLDGAGACLPEDCGGLYGYYNMLGAIDDPEHDDHWEKIDWLGEDFNPDAFDVTAVNGELKGLVE